MLDNALKQTFIELSIIILVVFVWTSLENLSKSNVTFNTLLLHLVLPVFFICCSSFATQVMRIAEIAFCFTVMVNIVLFRTSQEVYIALPIAQSLRPFQPIRPELLISPRRPIQTMMPDLPVTVMVTIVP